MFKTKKLGLKKVTRRQKVECQKLLSRNPKEEMNNQTQKKETIFIFPHKVTKFK